jgi:Raf kinase inhibitor-like YbhB/YbcL family protein
MVQTFSVTSTAFENNGMIPAKYTCDGDKKLSPPLTISGVPDVAKSLVLIMDDPDIPEIKKKEYGISAFDHWVLFNIIPPEAGGALQIPEGCPSTSIGVPGATTRGELNYTGPCPPPEYEPSEHRYIFKLYALSAPIPLEAGATKQQVLDALEPFKLAEAELVGRYSRK